MDVSHEQGLSLILSRGLNGLWGGWWHQTFRMGFAAQTNYLVRHGWLFRSSRSRQSSTTAVLTSKPHLGEANTYDKIYIIQV